jgi:hypothetical protein
MCPACLSALALTFAGVTSMGGLTLLVARKARGRSGATVVDPKRRETETLPCSTIQSCPQTSGLLLVSST